MPIVMEPPQIQKSVSNRKKFAPQYQVILYNDEVHTFDEVISALQTVFGHDQYMAKKLAQEANDHSRAIVEVEDYEKATLHKEQMQGYSPSFTVDIEAISL